MLRRSGLFMDHLDDGVKDGVRGTARLSVRAGAIALAVFASVHSPLTPVFAAGPGSTGLQVLKSDISPRAMGMGGAFSAIADDVYSMNYNPAGLGQLYMPEASAMYLSGF